MAAAANPAPEPRPAGHEGELDPGALEVCLLLAVVGIYSLGQDGLDKLGAVGADPRVRAALGAGPSAMAKLREIVALRLAAIETDNRRDVDEAFAATEAAAARLRQWLAEVAP